MATPTGWRREGNLPAELTSFVGRTRLLAIIRQRLRDSHLVTVTGIGGVGKSRTALRIAHQVQSQYPDGVWFIDLGRLHDPTMVAHTISATIGLVDQSSRSEVETLTEWLADRRLLLVLDTCEHVIDTVAPLVERLLEHAPGLRVLATSRHSFNLSIEQTMPVPPLTVPGDDPGENPFTNESVLLFGDRAAAVVPGFTVAEDNIGPVAELCRRLDGIPLAIELAAVRMRALSVEQILSLLADRFSLLAGASRTALPRHQTLKAAIGWSHELCEPAERLLWARLSIFAGDFELDAARHVCGDENLRPADITDLVSGLVEKSILLSRNDHAGVRYRLIDTLREYSREWLDRLGETQTLRRRHRDYYLRLAEKGDRAWSGPRQFYWYQRMRQEHDNIRTALDFCLTEPGEHKTALRLLSALWFMWVACGFAREGRIYLERALRQQEHEKSRERCRALWVLSYVLNTQGDLDASAEAAEKCSSEAVLVGDSSAVIVATKMQGTTAALKGDLQKAVALLGMAIEFHRGGRELNPGLLPAIVELAFVLIAQEDAEEAEALLRDCLDTCTKSGELWLRSHAHWTMALARLASARPGDAYRSIKEALRLKLHFHDVIGTLMSLETASRIAVLRARPARAARLLGAVDANWRLFGKPLFGSPYLSDLHDITVKECKEVIGEDTYEAEFREGQRLSLDEAVLHALDEDDDPMSAPPFRRAGVPGPARPPRAGDPSTSTAPVSPITRLPEPPGT